MTHLKRLLILPTLVTGIQLAQAAPVPIEREGTFLDHIEMITGTWWATTLVATVLLGVLIGYFVYRGAVSNGRAGGATGAGCLVAVIVFLVCQAVAIIVLAVTIFNRPVAVLANKDKAPDSTSKPNADGEATPQPKKPISPGKNNGDDF